jgi:DNA-binding transcriptional ArsR family regulator
MRRSQASEVFKVLGVSTRLKILEMLKDERPSPVKTIAGRLGVTPAAVSQHLKALKFAGLVSSERQGYWVPYSVNEEALERCCGILIQVCACPGDAEAARGGSSDELADLARRKRLLEKELQRVETRLESIRAERG